LALSQDASKGGPSHVPGLDFSKLEYGREELEAKRLAAEEMLVDTAIIR
jgi:hypothetical protein